MSHSHYLVWKMRENYAIQMTAVTDTIYCRNLTWKECVVFIICQQKVSSANVCRQGGYLFCGTKVFLVNCEFAFAVPISFYFVAASMYVVHTGPPHHYQHCMNSVRISVK